MTGLYGLTSYGNLFGATPSFYSNLSQYSSIRTGTYKKAVKAYYSQITNTETNQTENKKPTKNPVKKESTTKLNESNLALSTIKATATELVDSANKLTSTGKDNIFASESSYDKDTVYKAVNSFVNEYNDTMEALEKTTNLSVSNAGNSMARMTNVMCKSLSKIGITVDTDGKMSVDEDKFKNADMESVKSMFHGSASYAGIVSSSASRIASQASNQISQANGGLYGSNAYFNSYSSGLLFNGFF